MCPQARAWLQGGYGFRGNAGDTVITPTMQMCVVGADGAVIRRDVVASDPETIAKWLIACPP